MKKTVVLGCLAAVASLVLLLKMARPMQAPAAGAASRVCVLATLGGDATSVERWDGSARVSAVRVVAAEGRHFSAGYQIDAPSAWRAATREDRVAPFADVHYTEMRPGSKPPVLYHPVGVYLTIEPAPGARVAIETAQGKFDFALDGITEEPTPFLTGRVNVRRVPAPERLTPDEYQDDEPSIAALADGSVAAAWVAYRDRADRVLVRTQSGGVWRAPEEATPKPGDLWRSSMAATPDGFWVFWSERDGQHWRVRGRRKQNGKWLAAAEVSGDGSNTFHRASASARGDVFVVWQSYRNGQSDIYLRSFHGGKWSEEQRVSNSPANDWEPAVAAGADGTAWV
ncbi:MAG: hypothetical protein ACRD9L_23225, partial [Bryobacteraceae bacterium]